MTNPVSRGLAYFDTCETRLTRGHHIKIIIITICTVILIVKIVIMRLRDQTDQLFHYRLRHAYLSIVSSPVDVADCARSRTARRERVPDAV